MDYSNRVQAVCLVFFTVLNAVTDAASRCYSCAGISNPHDCQTVTSCTASQQCFTRSYISDVLTVKFDLGCQDNDFCSVLSKRSHMATMTQAYTYNAMMSPAMTPHSRRKRQLEAPLCTQCCDSNEHCNIDLCKNSLVSRPPGLKCYDCGNALLDDPSDCTTVRVCSSDQKCHVSEVVGSTGSKFVVKCLSDVVCNILGDSVLFGKRRKRDRYLCHTCCNTDHCNIDYCSRIRPLPTSYTQPAIVTTQTTKTTQASTTMRTQPLVAVQQPYNATREAELFPLSYTCQVTGLPAPSYNWQFTDNQGKTVNVNNMSVSQSGLSVLTLDPVLPKNEGSYTCVATNGIDTLTLTGDLIVYTKVTSKNPSSQTLSAEEGKTASFTCDFDSYPAANITWYKVDGNGKLVTPTGLTISSDQKTASFTILSRDKKGQYACVGDNGYEKTTINFDLKVVYKPAFITSPPDMLNVTEHGTLVFSCNSDGNPAPTYVFSFTDSNSNPSIVTGAVIFNNNGTLVISDVNSRYDQGQLHCRVDNQYGFVTHDVDISVI